jgi:Xaa-Pro aminopeptidase
MLCAHEGSGGPHQGTEHDAGHTGGVSFLPTPAVLAARRQTLSEHLDGRDIDACLVTHPANVTYLTGLVSSNAACLVGRDSSVQLATDDRYAQATATLGVDVVTTRDVVGSLAEQAAQRGGRLAVEQHHLTMAQGRSLMSVTDGRADITDSEHAVESLRARKEPGEVAAVAQACAISTAALGALLAGPVLGRTERDIARDLEATMLRWGADGLAFDTIVAGGPHGAVPHHRPTDRPVARGDLLTIDFGATVAGYHADCTRTVLVGSSGEAWQHEIHDVVRDAQARGVAALAPHRCVAEVDTAARDVVAAAGFGAFFVHGLGHGVGLQIHEPPWLTGAGDAAATLPPRTTVTVEPGIYLPGKGGVRIEDTTSVGPDGVEVLTDYPTDLLVVDE